MSNEDKSYPYKNLYPKIVITRGEDDSSFFDITEKDEHNEYWSLDHNTMKYFEEIEEIEAPNDWEDFYRINEGFLYHSQYIEFNNQCYELVRKKLGEYLDELFQILSTTNGKDNAREGRNFNDALSQSRRY